MTDSQHDMFSFEFICFPVERTKQLNLSLKIQFSISEPGFVAVGFLFLTSAVLIFHYPEIVRIAEGQNRL